MIKTKVAYFFGLRAFLAFVIILAAIPGVRSQTGFTLSQILSSPFPSSLVASSTGQKLAWVFNQQGRRNIWVAEGPEFKARQLSAFTDDDGRDRVVLGFTADGTYLLFVQDGRFNPDHDPRGGGGDRLLSIELASGQIRELARSGGAAISPVDDRIATSEGDTLWLLSLGDPENKKKLLTARGRLSRLSWSPDGDFLAMQSSRGEFPNQYSFIVVYDFKLDSVRYLDPSVYLDTSPVWSPDGTHIAFTRQLESDRQGIITDRDYPRPDPWSIRVADVVSGKTITAWASPPEDRLGDSTVAWLESRFLVFTSERDGWRHLYGVTSDGKQLRKLVDGTAEIESFVTVPQLGKVFYVSNQDDIDRRHLWSVGPSGGAGSLTNGASIEWSPVVTGDGQYLAYLGSDAINPAHVYLRPVAGGAPQRLAPETLPADFPVHEQVVPQQVILTAADKQTVHGQLFLPPAGYAGKRPAVIFFHGGPVRQMLLGWHYSSYYHNAYAMNQYLASRGYVVLAVNFRLGIGYGRDFRDVADGGPRGGSEYQDLLAGAKYLRNLDRVDAHRIGLWGGSYGGLMTALGLARNSDLFAAGVDFHGVHDWNQWQAWRLRRADDKDLVAWKSSPVADLDSWRSPVLLIHGDDDRNVPFSETVWLAKELKKRNVECELLVFPDEVHGFLRHQSWVSAYEAAAEFLDRKLGVTR